jgi:putative resolvase
MQMTVSIGRAATLLGVSVVTMRRWDKNDVITPAYRTAGNHRRYRLSDIRRLRGETVAQKVIGYARVSSHDQKADLVRQSQRLMDVGCGM